MENLFFEIIQVALGNRNNLSRVPSANDWSMLWGLMVKQAVAGVCFYGVQRLPNEQTACLPASLKMQWLAVAAHIQARNEDMNRKCADVYETICKEGFECVVLKGQGIAKLYSDIHSNAVTKGKQLGLYRQSGDIDVWIWKEGLSLKESKNEVVRFARSIQPNATETDLHIAVEWLDSEVELHYKPSYFFNPIANRRFCKWCSEYDKSKFRRTDNGFSVPDCEFNRVFLLSHTFRHYVREGLGLRQVMDYYFLQKTIDRNGCSASDHDRLIRKLGMARFEKAMRWVMRYVFEGKDEADGRRYGRMLLEHIMDGGNFGKYKTTTVASRHTHVGRFVNQLTHDLRLMWYYPREATWAPLSMIREFIRVRL